MGARQKLNSTFVSGSVLIAAGLGCAAGSWAVFVLAAVFLLALNLHSGDIRPGRRL